MGEKSASAVVMDVENGDVLALASVPSYDPNLFNTGLTVKQWNDLVNDPLHPLSNKAIAGLYAPGSTFKMMVALAALKAGIRSEEHTSELQSLMRISYAVFCLKKKTKYR